MFRYSSSFDSVKCVALAVVVFFGIIFQSSTALLEEDAECQKCEIIPPNDCQPDQLPPFKGGPPCSCAAKAFLPGCYLKPCKIAPESEVCDSSSTLESHHDYSYKFRCNAAASSDEGQQQCQVCDEVPPDCTTQSYLHIPADGGRACSCEKRLTPKGCTMKPCKKGAASNNVPCICRPGVEVKVCYNTTCPGNLAMNDIDDGEMGRDGETAGASSPVVVLPATIIATYILVFFCVN